MITLHEKNTLQNPPPAANRAAEAALFAAEDVFTDLEDIGEMLEVLARSLRKAGLRRDCDFAALFSDLSGLMLSIRWGAVALAKDTASQRLAYVRRMIETSCNEYSKN